MHAPLPRVAGIVGYDKCRRFGVMMALLVASACMRDGAVPAQTAAPAGFALLPASARPGCADAGFVQEGLASWYGRDFDGRRTANGEPFDMDGMTAAHRKLPMGSRITVTNLENGRSADFVVNDRGPFRRGRILDVSRAGARKLGFTEDGVTRVRVEAKTRC